MLAAQRDRWILWLPMGVIAGAALWLIAPRDPPAWAAPSALIAGALAAWALAAWPALARDDWAARLRAGLAGVAAMGAALGLGATAAHVRTGSVAAPRAPAPMERVWLEGWVASLEGGPRPRMRILVRALEGMSAPPRYVRISTLPGQALNPGRAVRCQASVQPPAAPLAPGAYDFARRAYFMRLGGVGFVRGRCRPVDLSPPRSAFDRALIRVAAMRGDLSSAIRDVAPGRGGAIAAALIAGDESAIDEPTDEALRDSGLGHLLSVSGLHMSVVGGLAFGALLFVFSLIAPIALRVPVKKIAAAGALIVLALYLVISGSSVPAIRAFIMASVAFGAVLIDRPAISMRGLALAALVIVLIYPESVLEPGFQMSFAATAALVAAFEAARRPPEENALPTPGALIGALQSLARGIGLILLTSLVAGLATDPFALFHFQRFALYGLPANLAVAPIVTFVVAPTAALAAIAAPFGLAEAPLSLMARALDLVAAIGETFGARPEAVRAFARPPDAFLVLSSFAIAWACLWRGALRYGAIGLAGAALLVMAAAPRAAFALDEEARALFVREAGADAWRLIAEGRRAAFARERLGGQLGIAPAELAHVRAPDGCSDALCFWVTPAGREAYLVRSEDAFAEACSAGAIVVSARPAPGRFSERCRPALLLDAAALAAEGGAIVTERGAGLVVKRARPRTARRAWTAQT